MMPAVGLGGWGGHTTEERENAWTFMLMALQSGYRLIDTAWAYHTEKATGEAIRKSGIPRDQIWVTTKLHNQHQGVFVEEYFEDSLKKLGLDYVDLLLLHWPQTAKYTPDGSDALDATGNLICYDTPIFNESWAHIEKIHASGRAKAIGVSNFSIKNLEKVFETAQIVPAVNQVEMHPYLIQQDLKDYCDAKGIVLTAYTPTGYDTVRKDPTILELAAKYGVSGGQIVLAWHVARGVAVVPKSANEQRQKDNINLPKLDAEDVKAGERA